MTEIRERHRRALQARILESEPPLPPDVRMLHTQMRATLLQASNERILTTPPQQIYSRLKLDDRDKGGHATIVGGDKNFHRDRSLPHFERDDGAWFDFAVTVAQRSGRLELIGYNFEIRFQDSSPLYIRFDLNEPGHHNESRDLRAHVHPGSDDLQIPSPLMSPLEVLEIVLYGLRLDPERAPRSKGQ